MLLITLASDVRIVPLINTFSLEIVFFLRFALTATHLWKMLSTIFSTVQCMLLILLLYLPLLPTYGRQMASGLGKEKD